MSEQLYSELILVIPDEIEFAEYIAKAEDAANGLMPKADINNFMAEIRELAEERLDLLQGDIQESTWAWKCEGWASICLDLDGFRLSVNTEDYTIILERMFFKDE